MYHHFFKLDRKDAEYWEYARFLNDPLGISIPFDLLIYMGDTLKWIPTLNPEFVRANGLTPEFGLNLYGVTVINKTGAGRLWKVFDSWAKLLSTGPIELELTGAWVWIEGEPTDSGAYSVVNMPRDETVSALRAVADYGKCVAEGNEDPYILHLGV